MNLLLLALIVGISILAFQRPAVFNRLAFIPYAIQTNKQIERFVLHAFVHGSWSHLLLNAFVLYIFGNTVESYFVQQFDSFGWLVYLVLFLGGVVVASAPGYIRHKNNPNYISIGASGGVSAVLFAYIMLFPLNNVYLFLIPIPIKAFVFGGAYLAYEYYMDKRGGDKIAHDAHFFGALYGIIFLVVVDLNAAYQTVTQITRFVSQLFFE